MFLDDRIKCVVSYMKLFCMSAVKINLLLLRMSIKYSNGCIIKWNYKDNTLVHYQKWKLLKVYKSETVTSCHVLDCIIIVKMLMIECHYYSVCKLYKLYDCVIYLPIDGLGLALCKLFMCTKCALLTKPVNADRVFILFQDYLFNKKHF